MSRRRSGKMDKVFASGPWGRGFEPPSRHGRIEWSPVTLSSVDCMRREIGGALCLCLCRASKRSHTWGKCVTCAWTLSHSFVSSINWALGLEGCTTVHHYHTLSLQKTPLHLINFSCWFHIY